MATQQQGTMGNGAPSLSSMDSTGKQLSQVSGSPRDTFSSMGGSGGGSGGGLGSSGPNLTSSDSDKSAKTVVPGSVEASLQLHAPISLTVPHNPLIQIQEPGDSNGEIAAPHKEEVPLPKWHPVSSDSSEELKRLARSDSDDGSRKSFESRQKHSPTKGVVRKHRRRASGSPRNCSSSGGSHSVSPAPSRSSSDSDDIAATSPQKRNKRTRRRSRNPSPVSGLLVGEPSGRKSPKKGTDSDIPRVRVEPMKQQESEVYWDSHKGSGEQEAGREEDRASPTQFEDAPSPIPEGEQKPTYDGKSGSPLQIVEPGDEDSVSNPVEVQV